jgi:hypothetical protein
MGMVVCEGGCHAANTSLWCRDCPPPWRTDIMNSIVSDLLERMKALELQLEAELARQHAQLKIGLENGRIAFEEEILRRHRETKTRLTTYLRARFKRS